MITKTEFTIHRSSWCRQEGNGNGRLLRTIDGKKCCLGFYLESLGVPLEILEDKIDITDIEPFARPTEAKWLTETIRCLDCRKESYIADLNDSQDHNSSPNSHEKIIADVFQELGGITVHFEE